MDVAVGSGAGVAVDSGTGVAVGCGVGVAVGSGVGGPSTHSTVTGSDVAEAPDPVAHRYPERPAFRSGGKICESGAASVRVPAAALLNSHP